MNFKPHLAYSASAGSGKTFALAVRYVSLLFMGESPASILAATFTNKAAGEMQERVVRSLRYIGEDEAFLDAVSQQTGMDKEALFAKQPEVLQRFLASPSHIVTLDSFFASILRSASLELGLEPDFVTKEQRPESVRRHFLEEIDANGMLDALVRLAMDIEDKRLKKIAALMEGFYKVDPLLPEHRYQPVNLSAIEEKIEACRAALHARVIDAGASATAINNFAPAAIKVLAKKTVFEKETLLEHRNYKKYVENDARIDDLFLELKGHIAKWMSAKETIVLHHLFAIYDHYKNALISHAKGSGELTFDDLSYFTYRLLHESVSREFLYFKIDARFKHILLDEFQDTSTLQFLLLKPLIDEIFAGKGQSELRSFFYVGDTKQSLYRFRGGVEELFDKIAAHYGIAIAQMDTNYRSARIVVDQVNRWFEGKMEGYIPQKSRPQASEGYVEVVESEEIVEDAVALAKRLIGMGVAADDIAFLVSTNKDGQTLQEACERAGIPTLLKTSSSLNKLPKVAAVVAMAAYLYDGARIDAEAMLARVGRRLEEEDFSWFHVFMSPLQVVDRLIRQFGYFDNDPNMLKLLNFASGFDDIPTFIEEFERSNIAIAAHSVHGVNIMTIHGSKGLEFDYVIVLDKLTRPNSDTDPLIFHYNDDLAIDTILYRMANREHFDATYAKIMEQKARSADKDRMNVLYVALTRAAEALFVIKKPEKSIFDPIEMVSMQRGVLQVKARSGEATVSDAVPADAVLGRYGTQEAVAQEEEGEEERDYDAILFGTALHYGLEMLGGFVPQSINDAMTAVRNRYGQQLDADALHRIEERITRLVHEPSFIARIKGAQIRKEQPFVFRGENRQIDLLLEYEDRLCVVDYKSSRKYHFKHQAQVRAYMEAVSKITGKPTEGVLVYLLEEEIHLENLN